MKVFLGKGWSVMVSMFSGSLYNSVKLINQHASWNALKSQKLHPEKTSFPTHKNISISKKLSSPNIDVEKEKVKMRLSSIDSKLKGGVELTTSELEFLKKHSPPLYRNALEVIHERRAYKDALHRCKTKEDVERLHNSKLQGFLSRINSIRKSNLPKNKKKESLDNILKILMGCQNEYEKFTNSSTYLNLPKSKDLKLPVATLSSEQNKNTISFATFQRSHPKKQFVSLSYKKRLSKNKKDFPFIRQV